MSGLDDETVNQLQENTITTTIGGIFYGTCGVIPTYHLTNFRRGLRHSVALMFIGQTLNLVAITVSELKIMKSLGTTPYDPTVALYFLSDVIVVWRAWILYNDRFYLRILLGLCVLGSLVGVSLDSVFVLLEAFTNSTGEANSLTKIRVLMPTMLLITNFTATVIITMKTWDYRRTIKLDLGHTSQKSDVEQILLLLLESGLIYCACWVYRLYNFTNPGALSFAGRNVFATLLPHLTAIYPTLIIILVTAQKSYSESSTLSVAQSSLQFSSTPLETAEDK
ncbi:hypothetical protein BDP27DRAFT_1316784 [Rhodocollybia butyracea]|uniref:Uncharacterized protein n=1 Tax=Rhodocollybia butyracea TaxID=206335 RepID=A0A9P5Q539_9AGAR|nr:hypothetical protein BDP27DRAFT_1316784 [Rhodocollybia butyracea]